jgi:hypothetical protein
MRLSKTTLLSACIGAAAAFASGTGLAEPDLFEMLNKPAYVKSWNELLSNEKDVDAWLANYARTKNGPTIPGKVIQLTGGFYQLNMVCKTHDCGDNQFWVLFAPDGSRAWGLLLKNRTTERFFGRPDDEKKKALRSATTG